MIDGAQLLICLQPLGPVPSQTCSACSDVSCRQSSGGRALLTRHPSDSTHRLGTTATLIGVTNVSQFMSVPPAANAKPWAIWCFGSVLIKHSLGGWELNPHFKFMACFHMIILPRDRRLSNSPPSQSNCQLQDMLTVERQGRDGERTGSSIYCRTDSPSSTKLDELIFFQPGCPS